VQNLRSKTLDRMGFGYDAVKAENPGLVYCSMTAYGNAGPMQRFLSYDPLMQAFGRLMSVTGEPDGAPVQVGTSIRRIAGQVQLIGFSRGTRIINKRFTTEVKQLIVEEKLREPTTD